MTLTGLTRTSQTQGMSSGASAGGRVRAPRCALVTLELVTGAMGLAGGVLLAAAPDGTLLRTDPATLAGTPLEAVFAVVGMVVIGIAWHLPRPQP